MEIVRPSDEPAAEWSVEHAAGRRIEIDATEACALWQTHESDDGRPLRRVQAQVDRVGLLPAARAARCAYSLYGSATFAPDVT